MINNNNKNLKDLLEDKSLYEIESNSIIEIEHIIDIIVLKLVRIGNINQKNWLNLLKILSIINLFFRDICYIKNIPLNI